MSPVFQSTHPLRGATVQIGGIFLIYEFQSTHPLRGATRRLRSCMLRHAKFQSTHPLRGATFSNIERKIDSVFQSTHPLRGATGIGGAMERLTFISIHAPLAGCDEPRRASAQPHPHFNPRTPCGVRRATAGKRTASTTFQSTHPLRGATRAQQLSRSRDRFQSTHPLRGATTP